MNHEIRFEINQELKEKIIKHAVLFGRSANDFARSLCLLGLETFELKLSEKQAPVFEAVQNTKILKLKYLKK